MAINQIIDNIILVQEAIASSKAKKDSGMAIKLDMDNAFDRVRNSFLKSTLKKFRFAEEFIDWIGSCIGSPWITPLINGRTYSFFQASRGLCQGSPLSPILYILMA